MTAQPAHRTTTALAAQAGWAPEPLRAAGTVATIMAGRQIFAEGSESEFFYRVIGGVVRVCKFLSDGRRQIEAFHVAGDVFGLEMAGEHALSAEAVSDCTLVFYRRRNIESLAQTDGSLGHQMFQFALQTLAQTRNHSLLLSRRGAAEKVAAFLLTWPERTAKGRALHLAMTRQDIADYLGLTIESVSRSLSQLERDGIIALPSTREVWLNNLQALEELAA